MGKPKTYAVFNGRKPDVYSTWEEAHEQVNKFSGNSHRSFHSRDEAIKAFDDHIEKQAASSSFSGKESWGASSNIQGSFKK